MKQFQNARSNIINDMFNSCEECDYDYIFHRAADFAKHQADNVRIDTHENNLIMQRLKKSMVLSAAAQFMWMTDLHALLISG